MTLLEARNKVRKRTRHVNDTVRLTDPTLDEILNAKHRELRTELQGIAPTLHVEAGPELTVPTGETLSTAGAERVYRVERKDITDRWRPVPVADTVEPEQHAHGDIAWEERGGCITLHPEGEVSSAEFGLFRVLYYPLTADLTDPDHLFSIPSVLEDVLIYRACADVVGDDGDDKKAKYFLDSANTSLERIRPSLEARYGVHTADTYREVLGY